jgi:hypothetical protein
MFDQSDSTTPQEKGRTLNAQHFSGGSGICEKSRKESEFAMKFHVHNVKSANSWQSFHTKSLGILA